MKPALFIDRDGVINRKGGSYYITTKDEFIINDGVTETINYFRANGYLIIVITNQGCVAKGICSEDDLAELHSYMNELLGKEGAAPDAVYYCPHHPDISVCECRKPGNLLIEKAVSDHEIDRIGSIMIGDSDADCEAAGRSGIRCIKVPENCSLYNWLKENRIV